jgi:hypothetical protein
LGSFTRHFGLRWAAIATHRRPRGIEVTGSPSKPMGAHSATEVAGSRPLRRPEGSLGHGQDRGIRRLRQGQVCRVAVTQHPRGRPGYGYWFVPLTSMRALGWVISRGQSRPARRFRQSQRRIWRVALDDYRGLESARRLASSGHGGKSTRLAEVAGQRDHLCQRRYSRVRQWTRGCCAGNAVIWFGWVGALV